MGKQMKLVYNRKGIEQLMAGTPIVEDVTTRTDAIREACNASSSWGGYNSEVDTEHGRPRGRIWNISRSDTIGSDRATRIVLNLDAGR